MAGEIVSVNLTVFDGKNRSSTISVPFKLDALTTVASLGALVKFCAETVSKLTTAGLKKAELCLLVDASAFWDDTDEAGDVVTFGDVQEKAIFAFNTVPDAIGKIRQKTITIPAVNDAVVFLDGVDAINTADADVQAFISMFENGKAGLDLYGGLPGDVVSSVDSRGLDIASFADGGQTWANRRR